jgi:hypothetical protein
MKSLLCPVLLALFTVVDCPALAQQVTCGASTAVPKLPSEFSVRWNFQAEYTYRVYTGLHEFSSVKVEPGTGLVTGTVDVRSNNCKAKNVPVEGRYNGKNLNLKTTQDVGACGILTVDLARTEGRSFKGTYGYSSFAGLGGMGGTFLASVSLPEE